MTWLLYSLSSAALFALWGFFGKIALKTATPAQVSILYGVAAVAVAAAVIVLAPRTISWSPSVLWVGALSGACGGLGLMAFYMALEQGKASIAVPIIGLYPAVVAVLSVAFLNEQLNAVQTAGVILAVAGVVLLGAGG